MGMGRVEEGSGRERRDRREEEGRVEEGSRGDRRREKVRVG